MSLIATQTKHETNAPSIHDTNQHEMNHSANQNKHQINVNEPVLNSFEIKEKPEKGEEVKKESQLEGNNNHHDEDTALDLEHWQKLKEMTIEGTKCKLVPYTVQHVKTYNTWLNDPDIQQMTQTEPYSLEQEYEYQQEWKQDESKYIFIILDKNLQDAMVGDINIFILDDIGELNIMIAEDKSRRKGLATETLQLIIDFARKYLELKTFIAKISNDNETSIQLFKKMGFVQTEFVEAFKEYTFTLSYEENNDNDQNIQFNTVKYTD
eukprot:99795_1